LLCILSCVYKYDQWQWCTQDNKPSLFTHKQLLYKVFLHNVHTLIHGPGYCTQRQVSNTVLQLGEQCLIFFGKHKQFKKLNSLGFLKNYNFIHFSYKTEMSIKCTSAQFNI